MNKPDALLLDAGNTVVFLDHILVSKLLAHQGWVIEASSLQSAQFAANQSYAATLKTGQGHQDAWNGFMATWLAEAGLANTAIPAAVAMLKAEHDIKYLWRRLPDGLIEAITALRAAGFMTGIISNSEGRLAELFAELELLDLFDVLLDSKVEGLRKPDPAFFLRACKRLHLAPERCLYAGDIPEVDVVGARSAGLEAVLIDAFGLYSDYTQAPRFESVSELCQNLINAAPLP